MFISALPSEYAFHARGWGALSLQGGCGMTLMTLADLNMLGLWHVVCDSCSSMHFHELTETYRLNFDMTLTSCEPYSRQTSEESNHICLWHRMASSVVVQETPNLMSEKLQWLQRHDKECRGLYGLFPVCFGLPVRATDHLDRKQGILKGTKGVRSGLVNDCP